jgi:hypothetical protein
VSSSSRSDKNDRNLPSGLHRWSLAELFSTVMGMASPPASGTIQTRVTDSSSSRSAIVTVNATHFPSGLTRGSSTSPMAK